MRIVAGAIAPVMDASVIAFAREQKYGDIVQIPESAYAKAGAAAVVLVSGRATMEKDSASSVGSCFRWESRSPPRSRRYRRVRSGAL